jgi:hypothetical protein
MLLPYKNQKLSEVFKTKTFYNILPILRPIYMANMVEKKQKSLKTPKISLRLSQNLVFFQNHFFHEKFFKWFSAANESVSIPS